MKHFSCALFIFLAGLPLFGQQEAADVWSEMFDSSTRIADRLLFVQEAAKSKDAGITEFLAKAVAHTVNAYTSLRSYHEFTAADEIIHTAAPVLAEAGYTEAAPSLRKALNRVSSGLARAEILIALGKMGDKEAFPYVVQVLRSLNAQPEGDPEIRKETERAAYGAIVSLENFKDTAGYDAVLFASASWYSQWVKNQAAVSLANLSEDPTELFIALIKSPAPTGAPAGVQAYEAKHIALENFERSDAADNRKALVALTALTEGWKASTSFLDQKRELAAMRSLALDMLTRYCGDGSRGIISELRYTGEGVTTNVVGVKAEERDTSEELCAALVKSYELGNMDEKKRAIQVLRALGSNDAAQILTTFLKNLHTGRMTNTITAAGEELTKVIIPALGDIGKRTALPALKLVKYSTTWTGQIRRLAESAIKKIEATSA